jgi:hypothetical protein
VRKRRLIRVLLAAVILVSPVLGLADSSTKAGAPNTSSAFEYLKNTPASLLDLGLYRANEELGDTSRCIGRRDTTGCHMSLSNSIEVVVEQLTGAAIESVRAGIHRPETGRGNSLQVWAQVNAAKTLPNTDACRLALWSVWNHVEQNWGQWFLPKTMDGHLMANDILPELHERFSEEMTFTCYCMNNGKRLRNCSLSSDDHREVEAWEDQVFEKYRTGGT